MTDQVPENSAPGVNASETPRGREETNFYPPYADFAKNVRTWFLAFGVGAPVLLLTNKEAGEKLVGSGSAELVALAYLIGVAVQVLTALMYKTAMWYLYMGELDPEEESRKIYLASRWLSDKYWIEFVLDAITFCLFAWATVRVVKIFVS